jgi:hypothetical protein
MHESESGALEQRTVVGDRLVERDIVEPESSIFLFLDVRPMNAGVLMLITVLAKHLYWVPLKGAQLTFVKSPAFAPDCEGEARDERGEVAVRGGLT